MIEPLCRHHGVVPVENSLSGLRIDVTSFLRSWRLGSCRGRRCALTRTPTGGIQGIAAECQKNCGKQTDNE